jgi:hypothetical protein
MMGSINLPRQASGIIQAESEQGKVFIGPALVKSKIEYPPDTLDLQRADPSATLPLINDLLDGGMFRLR